MRVIVTSEQIEFKTSYYSIIFPRQANLKITLWFKQVGNVFLTRAENTNDLDKLNILNDYDVLLDIRADKKNVKFYGGLFSRIYYYLRMDGLYTFLLGRGIFHQPMGNDSRTIIIGAKRIREILTDLRNNGYSVEMETGVIESITKQLIIEQRTVSKFIGNLNLKTIISIIFFSFIALFILFSIAYYIIQTVLPYLRY